jgi:hypothetical protein
MLLAESRHGKQKDQIGIWFCRSQLRFARLAARHRQQVKVTEQGLLFYSYHALLLIWAIIPLHTDKLQVGYH